MARKLQKVSVYIRIRLTDGSQPYCPAIWESKQRLSPHWCLVRGKPEHHPEGVYHVRYRVNGKPVWEKVCVGDDPYGKRQARLMCRWPGLRKVDSPQIQEELRDGQASSRGFCSPNPKMVGAFELGNDTPLLGDVGRHLLSGA